MIRGPEVVTTNLCFYVHDNDVDMVYFIYFIF